MNELEFSVYEQLLHPEDVAVLRETITCRQSITFWCGSAKVCSRMSGEMNTSLGNGLCNLLSLLSIVRQHYGERWNDVRAIIEGDDGIFVTPPNVVLTSAMFRECGFSVKLEEVDSLGKAGFCSTYFTEDGRSAIVEPMKCLLGIGWSIKANANTSNARLQELRSSKALSCYYEYPGVPILSVLGERLVTEYGETERLIADDWYENQLFEWALAHPERPSRLVTYESRLLFADTFGWTLPEQFSVEQHIREAPLCQLLHHPSITSRCCGDHRDCFSRYVVENNRKLNGK